MKFKIKTNLPSKLVNKIATRNFLQLVALLSSFYEPSHLLLYHSPSTPSPISPVSLQAPNPKIIFIKKGNYIYF